MPKTLTFGDVEALLVANLNVGVPVATRIPANTPPAFVRVIRTGGVQQSRISDRPIVTVEAFAQTGTAAWALIQECRSAMFELANSVVAGHTVYDVVEVGGPVNLPHPPVDRQRYTATFEIQIRGVLA